MKGNILFWYGELQKLSEVSSQQFSAVKKKKSELPNA